jgi:hypothetical protein
VLLKEVVVHSGHRDDKGRKKAHSKENEALPAHLRPL